jgi:hypothetical protein
MVSPSNSYNCNSIQSSRDPVSTYGVGSNISALKTNSGAGYSSNSGHSNSGNCSSAAVYSTDGYSNSAAGYSTGGYSKSAAGYSTGGYSNNGCSNGSYISDGYSNSGYSSNGYSNGGYTSSGYSNGYANDGYSTTGYSTGGYCTDGYSTADNSSASYSNNGYSSIGHAIDTSGLSTCINGGYSTAAIPAVMDPSNSICPLERLARSLLQLDVGGAQRPDNDNTAVPVVAVEDPELDSLVNSIIDDE